MEDVHVRAADRGIAHAHAHLSGAGLGSWPFHHCPQPGPTGLQGEALASWYDFNFDGLTDELDLNTYVTPNLGRDCRKP